MAPVAAHAAVISVWPRIGATLREYALLMRLHRPIGIWLLMWPMLWALWVAAMPPGRSHLHRVHARHADHAIRRLRDERLRGPGPGSFRHAHQGSSARGASHLAHRSVLLFLLLCLLAVGLLFTLNPLAQLYAVVGGVLTISYPFLKRFFPVPQFYLGAPWHRGPDGLCRADGGVRGSRG